MLTLTLLLAAAALLTWPGRATGIRLRGRTPRAVGDRGRLLATVLGGAIALLAAFFVLGPAGPVVALVLAAAGRYFWKSAATSKARIAAAASMAEAIRTMAAELDAGADPAVAAESAAMDAPPPVAAAVRAVSGAVQVGETSVREVPGLPEGAVGQLARSWTLAQRYGLPMAKVLGAVRRDLDASVEFAKRTHAAMSGPRTSVLVLAVVPLLGIGMGEAIDVQPLHMLAHTGLGQVALVLGTSLMAAGLAWTARLTRVAL
ncbi:type II secretion system F family protein [Amycolatopsis magusensis]